MKKKPFVKSFTINEKKWGRATERNAVSGLLRDAGTGKQCCLGIYLTACGYTDEELNSEGSYPKGVRDGHAFWNNAFPNKDVPPSNEDTRTLLEIASDLADVNDAAGLKLSQRRKRIVEGFKVLGVKVKFK